MNFRVELTGTSPLLMHNPRMVDNEFEIKRQIAALTAKRKKTDDDIKAIERLEWYGGLYHENINGVETVVQPASKVRKCLVNTARIFKMGKQLERAVSFAQLHVPLAYDGPRDIDAIFAEPRFHSRLSVGVNGKRVMRVRPQFFPWGMELTGVFVEDAGMNWEDLERIVELAGTVEGIGDNRVNGYGRFEAVLTGERK